MAQVTQNRKKCRQTRRISDAFSGPTAIIWATDVAQSYARGPGSMEYRPMKRLAKLAGVVTWANWATDPETGRHVELGRQGRGRRVRCVDLVLNIVSRASRVRDHTTPAEIANVQTQKVQGGNAS